MRALDRLLLCLLAPARAQHSNSPLFVFVHVVKTGGTAMEMRSRRELLLGVSRPH